MGLSGRCGVWGTLLLVVVVVAVAGRCWLTAMSAPPAPGKSSLEGSGEMTLAVRPVTADERREKCGMRGLAIGMDCLSRSCSNVARDDLREPEPTGLRGS